MKKINQFGFNFNILLELESISKQFRDHQYQYTFVKFDNSDYNMSLQS